MPNQTIFTNINIVPLRGYKSATVTWDVKPPYTEGKVHVYYSPHGIPGSWTMLTGDEPIDAGIGMFVDTKFDIKNGIDVGYYRLLLVLGESSHPSESVGILDTITRKEYGIIQKIMRREHLSFRSRNGIPMWHCIPRSSGDIADNIDAITGQVRGVECVDVPEEDASYGLKYKGGFYDPVLTWVRPIQMDIGTVRDMPDGDGVEDSAAWNIRLPAFPRPKRGHMFVDPKTDNRYVVGEEIRPFALRGAYPVAYEARLMMLERNDARYRFRVPDVKMEDLRKTPI